MCLQRLCSQGLHSLLLQRYKKVVLAMEEIDEPVSDAHEIIGSPLLDELLNVTHIVVYEDVWLHIAQGHNILQEFCLVSVTVRVDFSMDVATHVEVGDTLDMGGGSAV